MDVYARKVDFLERQIRILSQKYQPAADWRDGIRGMGDGSDIGNKALEKVMYKLNVAARRHQKMHYSAQAVAHVAEQICELYRQQRDPLAQHRTVMSAHVDLTKPTVLEELPQAWPDEDVDDEELQQEYQQVLSELSSKAVALQTIEQKHAEYQRLHRLVEHFRNPQQSVQPNLLTKDGPVAAELDRMRILAAKVAARMETALTSGRIASDNTQPPPLAVQTAESLSKLSQETHNNHL